MYVVLGRSLVFTYYLLLTTRHAGGLLTALEDKKKDVRSAAAEALSQPAVLAMHARQVRE